MPTLTYPFSEEAVRGLKAGDSVEISGIIYTGREAERCQSTSATERSTTAGLLS